MLAKKFSKIVSIWLLACSIVMFSDSAADSAEDKQASQGLKKTRVGGGGTASTSNNIGSNRRIVKKNTAKSVTRPKTARKTLGVNRHPMAVPEKFPKDGVYLWCDPDGLWTMFWKGKQKLAIYATITTAKPLIVKNAVKSKTKKLETHPNSLEISSYPNSRIGIVQFASLDDSVQFNILINGKSDPNSIFVGSLLNNPTQFPLKLNTRWLSHDVATGTNTVKREESQGVAVPNKSVVMYSNKIAVVAGGHGDGGSGGNKTEKAKR